MTVDSERLRRSSGNKNWLIYGTAACLGATFVIGLIGSVRNKQTGSNFSPLVPIAARPPRADDGQGHELYREKAKRLRAEWGNWAESHKDLLIRMRNSRPGSNATALRNEIVAALAKDPGPKLGDLTAGGTIFSWQLRDESSVKNMEGTTKTLLEKNRAHDTIGRQSDMDRYHDIAWSYSISPGFWRTTLWASGRVTESEAHFGPRVIGKHVDIVQGAEREVTGPYSFLH